MPLLAAGLAAACAPTLDWRELHPEDAGGVTLLFPCKPDRQARTLNLAGAPVRLTLHACSAGGSTWALAVADVGDPARVSAALQEMKVSAQRNLGAAEARESSLTIEGATPNPASVRLQFQGHMPDGQAVGEQLAVFTKGSRVFQVVALGPQPGAEAAGTFFGSIRFVP